MHFKFLQSRDVPLVLQSHAAPACIRIVPRLVEASILRRCLKQSKSEMYMIECSRVGEIKEFENGEGKGKQGQVGQRCVLFE